MLKSIQTHLEANRLKSWLHKVRNASDDLEKLKWMRKYPVKAIKIKAGVNAISQD